MKIIIKYEDKSYNLLTDTGVKELKSDITAAKKQDNFFYLNSIYKQLSSVIDKKSIKSDLKEILEKQLLKIKNFLDEDDGLINDPALFPRSEYYTRFKLTTAFDMKEPAYWSTYHRSEDTRFFKESGKRQTKFLSPCTIKPTESKKISSFHSHAGGFPSPFVNKKYQKITQLSVLAPNSEINFRDISLKYKNEMCRIVVESFRKAHENDNAQKFFINNKKNKMRVRPIVFHENDFPCVLIKLPILNPAETNSKEAAKYWSKHSARPFQNLLLASFVGILNMEAFNANLPIEMVIRASFGHNSPSICETSGLCGKEVGTFRINVGLIPKCYAELIGKSLKKLNDTINQLGKECTTEPPFDDDFYSKVRRYNAKKLKEKIDGKIRYESLKNTPDYQNAESRVTAFERLYKDFSKINKNKGRKGGSVFKPVRLEADNVWDVLIEAGDSGSRSILTECFREHQAVDYFADMVMKAISEEPDQNPVERALLQILKYLNFDQTASMDYAKMRKDLKTSLKYSFDENSFESCYQNDASFNRITQLLFDGLGSQRPNINLYSAMEQAGIKFFSLVKGNEDLTDKPDYGSDSEFSVSDFSVNDDIRDTDADTDADTTDADTDADTDDNTDTTTVTNTEEDIHTIHFSHTKLRVCSGMKAIVLAHYGALFFLRQQGAKEIKRDTKLMYYEVPKILDMVKDSNLKENKVRSARSENFSILHFDLNYCNSSNAFNNDVALEHKLDEVEPTVVILDYSSSTVEQLLAAQKSCLSRAHIKLLILVESGLKNSQAGLDFNPYGEVRLIAREREICDDVRNKMIKKGLDEKDKLPQHAHELVRACKNRGFSLSLYGLFKTKEKRFQKQELDYESILSVKKKK